MDLQAALQFQAPRLRRVFAALGDSVLLTVAVVLITAVAATASPAAGLAVGICAAALRIALPAWWLSRPHPRNGQTPFKRLVGIRVFTDGGTPLRFWRAAARCAVAFVFELLCPMLLLSAFSALVGERRLAAHDEIVGTHVLRESAPMEALDVLARSPDGAYRPRQDLSVRPGT